jgi:hypothetical protein
MTPTGLVAEPIVEARRQEVVGEEHDERAALSPGLGLRAGDERAGQSATAERFVDPHRVQLAVPAPDDAGDASEDPTLVVAEEDSEVRAPPPGTPRLRASAGPPRRRRPPRQRPAVSGVGPVDVQIPSQSPIVLDDVPIIAPLNSRTPRQPHHAMATPSGHHPKGTRPTSARGASQARLVSPAHALCQVPGRSSRGRLNSRAARRSRR